MGRKHLAMQKNSPSFEQLKATFLGQTEKMFLLQQKFETWKMTGQGDQGEVSRALQEAGQQLVEIQETLRALAAL